MNFALVLAAVSLAATTVGTEPAEIILEQGSYKLTVETSSNFSGTSIDEEDHLYDADNFGDRFDARARFLGLYETEFGYSFGQHVTLRPGVNDELELAERSLLTRTPWGQVEIGNRRGFPDLFRARASSAHQILFNGAGASSGCSYGVRRCAHSGIDRALAGEIRALTGLGMRSSLFFDESAKIIYTSPRRRGFSASLAYSPDAGTSEDDVSTLMQESLTYEKSWRHYDLRLGGTYAEADADYREPSPRSLRAASVLTSVTIARRLTLGTTFIANGFGGHGTTPSFDSNAKGHAYNLHYNGMRWNLEGLYHSAQSEGDASIANDAKLRALQFGASREINSRLDVYGSMYLYDFDSGGSSDTADDADGQVVMFGARLRL